VSDDAVDYAYEEQLKAEHGYRELWVRFAGGEDERVRTFPDTEDWCEAADRLAFELLADPDVEKVWSIPMGAGKVGVGRDASTSVDDRTPPPSECCQPIRSRGPSGIRLRHAWTCERKGQPWDGPVAPDHDGVPPPRRDRLSRLHAIETRRVGLDDPVPVERAGGVLTAKGAGCPAHPLMPIYECPTCAERRV
jgi:hypothetical protein